VAFGHLESAPELFHAVSDPYDHDQMSFPFQMMVLFRVEYVYYRLLGCLRDWLELRRSWLEITAKGEMTKGLEKKVLAGNRPRSHVIVEA